MTDALSIAEKHIDRIAEERKRRAQIIKANYPEMYAEIMDLAKTFGAKVEGFRSPVLSYGDMCEEGVTADVWLANSEMEKYMKQRKEKK